MINHSLKRAVNKYSRYAYPTRNFVPKSKIECVIFDKDGTLIDFNLMWVGWAFRLCNNISRELGQRASLRIASALRFDQIKGKVGRDSPICCTPMHVIFDICQDALSDGSNNKLVIDVLDRCWAMPDPTEDCKPLTDLQSLFHTLTQEIGVKVAICTTDNRLETEKTLQSLKLDKYVSTILCGDDKHVAAKPSPDQIHHICKTLGVNVSGTVMVGDTITDMKMARSARVALGIGIPYGAGQIDDLLEHADVVLPSMDNFIKVLPIE